ncbi:hypothetical protein [Haloplanus salilacus]|uniref:hypothetical protein n=1 Tax=Haloplanus salilacus TaxID=2949994 RepID=UPI0030CB06C7
MDITDLPTISYPIVDGPLEYYLLGEAHLATPTDRDAVDASTWADTRTVDLQLQAATSGADVVCTHHLVDATDADDSDRYVFRLTDPRRTELRPNGDYERIPVNVRRALLWTGFADPTAPAPRRPHELDYLCSLHATLASAATDSHPLVQVAMSTLSALLKTYALGLGLQISIPDEEFSLDDLGLGVVGDVFTDADRRREVAAEIVTRYDVDGAAVLPKVRDIDMIEWHADEPPTEPPYTVPASRDHRGEALPAVTVLLLRSDGDLYLRATAFTRFSFDQYWFRIQDEESRTAVLEHTRDDGAGTMPPVEVYYELYTRGFTVDNLPRIPDGESLAKTVHRVDDIVAHVEGTFGVRHDSAAWAQEQYRDLVSMLLVLERMREATPAATDRAMDAVTDGHPLPIESYAASPIVSEGDLHDPETIEAVVESLGAVSDRIDGAGRHLADVVDGLRWDGNLDDA